MILGKSVYDQTTTEELVRLLHKIRTSLSYITWITCDTVEYDTGEVLIDAINYWCDQKPSIDALITTTDRSHSVMVTIERIWNDECQYYGGWDTIRRDTNFHDVLLNNVMERDAARIISRKEWMELLTICKNVELL